MQTWDVSIFAPPKMMACSNPILRYFLLYRNTVCLDLLLFSHSVASDSLWPHGLQHTRLPGVSFTISQSLLKLMSIESLMHPTISFSIIPFFCLQSFPASGSFLMSQHFSHQVAKVLDLFFFVGSLASTLASVLAMNIHGLFPLELTSLISLQSKGLSRVFSNTTVEKHQFFST